MPSSTLKKKERRGGRNRIKKKSVMPFLCREDPSHWAVLAKVRILSLSVQRWVFGDTTLPGSGLVQSRDGIVRLLMLDFTVRAGITAPHVRKDSRLRVPKRKNTSGPCPCRDCDERSGNIDPSLYMCVCVCARVCATGSHGRASKGGEDRVASGASHFFFFS